MPALDADRLLEGLDPAQSAAVTEPHTPLAILAGPGSGKTRVLTRRIAWRHATGALDPRRVLAVTFTRKAAGELVTRLAELGVGDRVTAGTFHALALAQLRRWSEDHDRRCPTVLERKGRILIPLLGGGDAARATARAVAGEIEWAKARDVGPEGYPVAVAAAGRRTAEPPETIAGWYRDYEATKHRRGLVDFEDLVARAAEVLETDEAFRAGIRWRFRHCFVDEFQDLTPAQHRLLHGWLGAESELCVVGDPDQAVYGFAGADARYLTGFDSWFPGGRTLRLDRCYRCPPEILEAARGLFGPDAPGVVSTLAPARPPSIVAARDDAAEAELVARALLDAHRRGRPWSDCAVLYRTNAQSSRFEEVFAQHGIPVRVRGDRRFLERAEVRAALARLRELRGSVRQRAEALTGETVGSDERAQHRGALAALAHEYLAADGGEGSMAGFEAWLTTAMRDAGAPGGEDAVELATFHRAKGLEWSIVYVTGLEEGLVPVASATSEHARAEERRLLYVACTRAATELHCTWAQRRTFGTRGVERRRSALVDELLPDHARRAETTTTAPRPDRRRQVAELRARLERGDPRARALVGALREWRSRRARAASVPAYVICPDRTLVDLVRQRPRSQGDLLGVDGIGPVRAERYGGELLEIVGRHGHGG